MFSQSLRIYTCVLLLILEIANSFCEKSLLDISMPTVAQIIHRSAATNVSEKQSENGSSVDGESRATNSSTSDDVGVDMITFHKQRRNGLGNSFEMEENLKRHFHLPPLPQHHFLSSGFENDLHHHQIHHHDSRNRYHDDIYPVRVQNCGQYLRDVNRFQNEASTHTKQGIVPGWIGGKSRWRDKNNENEDKRQESSTPTYVPVTTATAKVPTSFNRYQENRNNADKNYDSFRNKPIHIPVRSRLSDSEYRPEDSARPYYTSGDGHSEYDSERGTDSPWMPLVSTHADRNRPANRIIYYEYNLEDLRRRKPASFYSRDYARRPGDCGWSDNGFIPCDQNELGRIPYDAALHSNNRPYLPSAQSKSSSSIDTDEDNIEPHFSDDVTHFGRGIQHRYQGRKPNTDTDTDEYAEYEYVPGSSPSTRIVRFPFATYQFPNDERKYES